MKLFVLMFVLFSTFAFANESINRGKDIYNRWCVTCHGKNMPATDALGILYKDTEISAILDERTDLTPEFIEFYVRNGKHSMPFFRKTEINDKQLKDLLNYLTRDRK